MSAEPNARVLVCEPRQNALLQAGNQTDHVDARKLAELLHNRQLPSRYHQDHGLRILKELARSYLTIPQDFSRVIRRAKAIYRSWAIACTGKQVYSSRHPAEWLANISDPGVRRRVKFNYQQLDALRCLLEEVRRDLLAECKKRQAWERLCGVPLNRPDTFGRASRTGNPSKI
jgi:hypothetical protein